jgi:hypothetical protein
MSKAVAQGGHGQLGQLGVGSELVEQVYVTNARRVAHGGHGQCMNINLIRAVPLSGEDPARGHPRHPSSNRTLTPGQPLSSVRLVVAAGDGDGDGDSLEKAWST